MGSAKNEIVFSIIIPAYNCEKIITRSLRYIRQQDFDQDAIEILVVDGGSDDKTVEVASKYGAKIINNPDRLPEPAKKYGMNEACGKYMVVMGSDEMMTQKDLLSKRYRFLKRHPEVHGLIAELVAPRNYSFMCTYMNAVGDPFTCFVYKMHGHHRYNLRKKLAEVDGDGYIYSFGRNDIIPIGDGGTVMDLDYCKKHYADLMKTHETSVLWDVMIRDTSLVGIIKNDYVIHMSKSDWNTYLRKMKFRIINNVHDVDGSGYAFRARTNKKLNSRKYFYPFYCMSIVLPICDGIHMAIRMRKPVFLLHPIIAWYVMYWIVVEYIKKFVGVTSSNSVYG